MKKNTFLISFILVIFIVLFVSSTFAEGVSTLITIDENNKIIKNIVLGTTGDELNNLLGENYSFKRNNNDIGSNYVLITGDKAISGSTSYTLSIRGDIKGEGKISTDGIKRVAQQIIDKNILSGEALVAGDYNFNNDVKMNDVIYMLKNLNNDSNLANIPSRINYQKSNENGKFAFINNPEGIRYEFLADEGSKQYTVDGETITVNYGNRTLYGDYFNGNMELYYEHSTYEWRPLEQYKNSSAEVWDGFYYAIRFYNSNSTPVTLTINKAGSTLNTWPSTWERYYSDTLCTPQKTYTIAPNEILYFYHGKNGIDGDDYCFTNNINNALWLNGKLGFDGVLNVTSNGKLYFSTLAFKDVGKTANAKYPGNVDNASDPDNLRVYSGSVNQLPDLYNNATFVIDDSVDTSSNLKILCNNGRTYNRWHTNYIGAWVKNIANANPVIMPSDDNISCVYKDDILPISFKSANDKLTYIIKPYYEGVEGSFDNRQTVIEAKGLALPFVVGNWAVHYHENITIVNKGTKTRTLSFIMKPAGCGSTYAIVNQVSNNNTEGINYLDISNKFFTAAVNNPEDKIVWKVQIGSGKSITIPSVITLGGMSCGDITKYIYVNE